MKNSKSIVSVFILLAFSLLGVSAQAQRRPARISDRQVGAILQRLEQSSSRFRNSLNAAMVQRRIETRAQNEINSFEPAFVSAVAQFRNQFNQRRATAADVENILRQASLINGFMTGNRLNTRVQNDWSGVRTNLNALANAYSLGWNWNRQTLPPVNANSMPRLSDSELNLLIQRIGNGGDTFRSSLTDAFGESRYDRTRNESNMNEAVRSFKNATDQLRHQFDTRQPVAEYVERVIARAAPIDTYMRSNRLTDRAQNDWSALRADLNTLAGFYNLATNWQTGAEPSPYSSNNRLTGTYQLDASRSDNPREVAERATGNTSDHQRRGNWESVLARLESPQALAIDRRGSTITIASSRAQQSTFEADGVERQEQLGNGSMSRVTATLQGDKLSVRSTGYRENDFNVTFEPIDNGRRLQVRREIYVERLDQPIVVNSIYNRTSEVAQWNIYDASSPVLSNTGASGEFLVRDGEIVVAVLNNDLTTKDTKQGDRFTMTVREPGQYAGAVIEGTVGKVDQGGRLSGRSAITLNFDSIRLRDGQTYKFAGVLGSVRMADGEAIKIDNEGSAQGDNQTTQTIQRAGIGTAIGAIIGAIAGGGKGAAIGGIIGAAGGAGSVYVQGKDSLELPSGTELTIRASGPR